MITPVNCKYCGEDAVAIQLPDGYWFVRVRRASKCKSYSKTRSVSKSCKGMIKSTEKLAVEDWDERNK